MTPPTTGADDTTALPAIAPPRAFKMQEPVSYIDIIYAPSYHHVPRPCEIYAIFASKMTSAQAIVTSRPFH